jgi:hypothetical protein
MERLMANPLSAGLVTVPRDDPVRSLGPRVNTPACASVRECLWIGTLEREATVGRRSLPAVRPDELERRLRERLDALGPAPRAELLHVLRLPDLGRADRIGEFWGYPESRAFAELLIDCEEDRTLQAVLVGMLREAD